MGFDKNTVIGFVLIGVLLIGMFYMNSRNRLAYEGEQKRIADSIAAAAPKKDTTAIIKDIAMSDSLKDAQQQANSLNQGVPESITTVENDLIKIDFSNKGGQPKSVTLKKYKKFDSSLVTLQGSAYDQLSYSVNAGANATANTGQMLFVPSAITSNSDGSKTISFKAGDSTGKSITHQYIIRPNDYMVDLNISFNGADQLFSNNMMGINWQVQVPQIEKDHKYELTQTEIAYQADGKFDFERSGDGGSEAFTKPVSFLAVKQQFFIVALAAKEKFSSASIDWKVATDSSNYIMQTTANAKVKIPTGTTATVPLQIYYGPSDYKILHTYKNDMEQIVPYGSGVFAFVKYINRHLLLPVFDFISRNVASMGIVILLLTLFIRLLTSPILYKSYLSGAKMKVLKPEVDALKAKFKDPKTGELDQQAFSMEQMKLWKSAGVSPLGGCLPALLQIPIFMSLFYFFQSNISLRGKSFLWATDLSTYDSIFNLPFDVPFYGDHISLFTLTAVITSLLISLYSMNNMQDQSNPVMKYMPYIFPFLLLGVFNKLPAALTWYYTISNLITLILQVVIQKYIIDDKKLLAQIAINKTKPKKTSKFAERLAQMQEQQKQIKTQGKK